MAKIFNPPTTVPVPVADYSNYDFEAQQQKEDAFVADLQSFCETNGNGALRGKTVQYPVADGYACYMVFTEKPLQLVHIPVGDAWHFQYAHRLRLADVRKDVGNQEAMRALFGGGK